MKCIFCEIIAGRLPADIVYESNSMLAFLDIKPLFPGHVLIVSKLHYETLWDMPDTLLADMISTTKIISVAVRDALEADGIFTASNNIVSQSVPHYHMHVIPRRKKDGLKGFFWPRIPYTNTAHQIETKDKIKACLKNVVVPSPPKETNP